MAGRLLEHKGLTFEVWTKSLHLVNPKRSPMFSSYLDLTKDENAIKEIENFITIMNIGVDIHQSRRI
jgi:hypothetical protein